ncbi:carboxylesterase hlo [Penicillium chermesinum]|uniref:Carboxylesterase hlo n=1 Tax=Penicillium chermesinum TaxID=63820 RepID=A0A9W9TEP3_9EURO|nr:carboxylesterase hlo [Penicillium chermesinum]KAJ5220052.1 carboxylesterase hlo [Penicillium chermesinum]
MLVSFLGFLLYIARGVALPVSVPSPTVTIDSGPIVGTTTSLPSSTVVVEKYLGVPFAQSPTRFEPSKPVSSWSTPYNATQELGIITPDGGESEDCLNLNVFTPSSKGSRPVLFWIYGGGYANGASSFGIYDGSSFAAHQDVVVVTSNYRTNVFGFPGGDVPTKHANLGLLDQRLALDWVQRNIDKLGGDPSQVTIMGESAGAGSVDALLTSAPDPLPFRAAIMESGQASVRSSPSDNVQSYSQSWDTLLSVTGCSANWTESSSDKLGCLRDVPATKIREILDNSNLTFGPRMDGVSWSAAPRLSRLDSRLENSSFARVPIMAGYNADEAKPFIVGMNNTKRFLEGYNLGLFSDAFIKEYPLGAPGIHTENDRISAIYTDIAMHCPIATLANDSSSVDIPTWRYFFNASFPNQEIFKGSGAFHSAEIPYVFGTYKTEGATAFEREVSQSMQKAWAAFAKNPTNGPGWDTVSTIGLFGDGVKVGMSAKGKKPLTTVDSSMDQRCSMYKAFYDQYIFSDY